MPKILLLFGFLFSHPSKGANILFEVATGKFRGQSGIFVMKGKIISLKFEEKSKELLQKLDYIHKNEFNKINNN